MLDLFGAEMPLTVRVFLAFLIVMALIGVAAWAIRRLGSARVGRAVRGRQPRLAVTDHTAVDARRRLILVRRDNVEHLVMIGGPMDVVVESNIVRALPASREAIIARDPTPAETSADALPVAEAESNESWPLQPEQPAPWTRARRSEPMRQVHGNISLMQSEPPPRPTGGGAGNALVEGIPPKQVSPAPAVNPIPQRRRPPSPVQPQSAESRAEASSEHRQEPLVLAQPTATGPSSADQSLAEITQRLEVALRKPKSTEPREGPPAPERNRTEPRAAAPAAAPSYDNLEQELASLLGRPSNAG
jgi:flagellar protein FliO/FliZ